MAYSADNQPTPEAKSIGRASGRTATEAAKAHAVSAVQVWLDVMNDTKAPHQARLWAAEKIVDRAEGKPIQPTISARVDDLRALSDDDLRSELARLSGEGATVTAGTARKELPN